MRAHIHRKRAVKAYFASVDHALAGRPALAAAKLEEAEREENLYEQARRERAERGARCG